MGQSSGGWKADKRAPAATPRAVAPRALSPTSVARGRVVTACAGALSIAVAAWLGRDALVAANARTVVLLTLSMVGGGLVVGALIVTWFTSPAASDEVRALQRSLDLVAAGDFSRDPDLESAGAYAPLARSARGAVAHARALLTDFGTQARDIAARARDLASQVTVAQATAQRAAETSSLAAHGSATLVEGIRTLHEEAVRLHGASVTLTREQRAATERTARARDAVHASVEELNAGNRALDDIAERLGGATADIDILRDSAEEIRGFIALVRKMSRQSKLLALNAAMEAARAGEQGSGFAVVASEVRRLARSSSEAADRTELLVSAVVERAARMRGVAQDGGVSLAGSRAASERAVQSLRDLERQLQQALLPDEARDEALARVTPLAESLSARLDVLARDGEAAGSTVRETQLSAAGQLARTQDLLASVSTLLRAAQKGEAGIGAVQLAPTASDPQHTLPASDDGAVASAAAATSALAPA